jgi:hypothetical protein
MCLSRGSRGVLCALLALVLWPVGVGAQTQTGPFGGLFGRTPERTGREFTAIDFRSSLGGQVDRALADEADQHNVLLPTTVTGGINGGLAFNRASDRLRLNARGVATYQELFRDVPTGPTSFGARSYDVAALAVARVATRLTFDANGSWLRSPFFNVLPIGLGFPTPDIIVPGEPFSTQRLANDTFNGRAGFTSEYTKRSTLSASVSRRETRFPDLPANNSEIWGAQALWTRKLNRDFTARAGYGREEIHHNAFPDSEFVHEALDLGVDFLRQFSVTRRTSLSFNTRTSMIRRTGGGRRYRLNGGIGVVRQFRRTWMASLNANRNTEFLPGFLEPIFSDHASASLAGMVGPRLEWTTSIGATQSQIGFENIGTLVTYSGISRVSAGVARHLGIYAQYSYYHYKLPVGSSAVVLFPQLSRQALSVGLSTWVPIFYKVRAPRDPR